MATKSAIKTPEVATFLEAKDSLEEFEGQHSAIFERYRELTADYNKTLEQADKAVRAQGVSEGPFVLSHKTTKIDADKLYDFVGREEFLSMGGKLETVVQYSIDKTKFTSMADAGKIPKDLVEKVVEVTSVYKNPKPVKLP